MSYLGHIQRHCVEMAVGDSDLSELGLTHREMVTITRSLRVGASGRSILAHLPEPLRRQVLSEPLPKGVGPGAYRDRDKLLASLADIQKKGYAIGYQEFARGWDSYAAPVIWGDAILGSVLLLKPSSTTPAPRDRYVMAVKVAAAEVCQVFGNAGSEGDATAEST
ncbi:IclR family transcriptional regulator C-terminal domain-containing protein [Streptomyces sp. NPDC006140]|uniref:IclR family transcriptional regulator domain-containing protein n=1 Tax=Streptomyces sp. NPDC006140 TaxID=3154579 RepID=UPI003404D306